MRAALFPDIYVFMGKDEHNTFRFAICDNDKLHSLIWRIWVDRGLILMLAPSNTAHISKVTFHFDKAERFCHFAVNKTHKPKMIEQGLTPPNHFEEAQWYLEPTPKPNALPLTLCSIVLSYNPLHYNPNPIKPKDGKHLLCLSPPPLGKAWQIILAATYHDPNKIDVPAPFVKHEHIQLATGEYILVLGGAIDFDSQTILKNKTLTAKTSFDAHFKLDDFSTEPRVLHLWNEPKEEPDNILRIYEFCGVTFSPTSK